MVDNQQPVLWSVCTHIFVDLSDLFPSDKFLGAHCWFKRSTPLYFDLVCHFAFQKSHADLYPHPQHLRVLFPHNVPWMAAIHPFANVVGKKEAYYCFYFIVLLIGLSIISYPL